METSGMAAALANLLAAPLSSFCTKLPPGKVGEQCMGSVYYFLQLYVNLQRSLNFCLIYKKTLRRQTPRLKVRSERAEATFSLVWLPRAPALSTPPPPGVEDQREAKHHTVHPLLMQTGNPRRKIGGKPRQQRQPVQSPSCLVTWSAWHRSCWSPETSSSPPSGSVGHFLASCGCSRVVPSGQ